MSVEIAVKLDEGVGFQGDIAADAGHARRGDGDRADVKIAGDRDVVEVDLAVGLEGGEVGVAADRPSKNRA